MMTLKSDNLLDSDLLALGQALAPRPGLLGRTLITKEPVGRYFWLEYLKMFGPVAIVAVFIVLTGFRPVKANQSLTMESASTGEQIAQADLDQSIYATELELDWLEQAEGNY